MYKYNLNSIRGKKISKDILDTRDKLIYQYRQQGMTLENIGVIFGLTRERVRQIIDEFKKSLEQLEGQNNNK